MNTAFDPRGAHTLICVQQNRSVPVDQQECCCNSNCTQGRSCPARVARVKSSRARPPYDVDGPYQARRSAIARALRWIASFFIGLVIIAALSLSTGAVLRHFNQI